LNSRTSPSISFISTRRFDGSYGSDVRERARTTSARTGQQAAKPELVALGTEVRFATATALLGNVGMLVFIYQTNPLTVAPFFDPETLRRPAAPTAGPTAAESVSKSIFDLTRAAETASCRPAAFLWRQFL